ncbi:MAG: fatty-acyl-CoA synthase, partial [Actinomycetota bacterium]|nr:fatty-acyl-CoA synthase [Actinomycetota bacterium]
MGASLDERRDVLRRRFPEWTPMTLHERLARCAEEFADRPMVITDERTVTYAEVAAWTERLADGLVAMGVRPGDRVGLVMANYVEFVPLKVAISRAGAIAIPFNYLYRTEELRYVLDQSDCNLLVTMTGFAGLDHLGMLDDIAPGWDRREQTALPELRGVVTLSTDGRGRE